MLTEEKLRTTEKQRIEINYPTTSFTFKNLEEMNPDVSSPTLRLRLKEALEDGSITKADEPFMTGKRGRSQHLYSLNNA